MTILIIEDETRAADRIERLLLEIDPTFQVMGKIESVKRSIEFLNRNKPDLIISDIQLADGLSFEIYEQQHITCPIIFTTAYDQYAMNAFETNGVDYLLKPIEIDRLRQALNKLSTLKPALNLTDLQALAATLTSSQKSSYKSRFMIKVGDKIKSIPVSEIDAFYSLDKGTYLHTVNNRNYVVEYPLEQLQELLDPEQFFKINRKFILAIHAPEEIIAHTNSRLKIKVKGFENESIIVAREKVKDFKRWLDR